MFANVICYEQCNYVIIYVIIEPEPIAFPTMSIHTDNGEMMDFLFV